MHTPGPWKVGLHIKNQEYPDSLGVLPSTAISGQRGPAICLISPHDKVNAQDEANAHLIAAAPDLLAACRRAEPALWILASQGVCDSAEIHRLLTDAIAKAEGRMA